MTECYCLPNRPELMCGACVAAGLAAMKKPDQHRCQPGAPSSSNPGEKGDDGAVIILQSDGGVK
jgi:hypothetical protein